MAIDLKRQMPEFRLIMDHNPTANRSNRELKVSLVGSIFNVFIAVIELSIITLSRESFSLVSDRQSRFIEILDSSFSFLVGWVLFLLIFQLIWIATEYYNFQTGERWNRSKILAFIFRIPGYLLIIVSFFGFIFLFLT